MEIKRDRYLNQLISLMWDGQVKVITGIRRCGKSVIIKQIMNENKEKGVNKEHIIYVNFELIEYESLRDYKELNKYNES